MQIYRHTQSGTGMRYALGLGMVAIGILRAVAPFGSGSAVAGAVLVLLLVCLFLFRSLTVEVGSERLAVWFGSGLIRKEFPMEEIRDARVVRNPWYSGWGIRFTPRGWMFNVSGSDAVELYFRDNRRFRIGTDEPRQLSEAIREGLRHAG